MTKNGYRIDKTWIIQMKQQALQTPFQGKPGYIVGKYVGELSESVP